MWRRRGGVRVEALEAWIRTLVPKLALEVHRWSGQVLETLDYCAFIGRNPDSKNVYVATGDIAPLRVNRDTKPDDA